MSVISHIKSMMEDYSSAEKKTCQLHYRQSRKNPYNDS